MNSGGFSHPTYVGTGEMCLMYNRVEYPLSKMSGYSRLRTEMASFHWKPKPPRCLVVFYGVNEPSVPLQSIKVSLKTLTFQALHVDLTSEEPGGICASLVALTSKVISLI